MADQYQAQVLSQFQGANSNLSALVTAFKDAFPLSAAVGTFTMSATASKTVTDAKCKGASVVLITSTNAAAGTLQGSAKHLYVTPGNGSFTVTTASGASAAGGENFSYVIVNVGY